MVKCGSAQNCLARRCFPTCQQLDMAPNREGMSTRLATAIALCLLALATIAGDAGEKDDIARAEKEFERREMAQALFDRASKRAKDAVVASSAGEDLRKKVMAVFDECMAEGKALSKVADDRKKPLEERQALLANAQRVLLSCPDRMAQLASGNDDLIAKLRDEFIEEEIEERRGVMDEEELALLEAAVRRIARS